MNILKKFGMLAVALVLVMPFGLKLAAPVYAQDITTNLDASKGDLADSDLTSLIGTMINVLISVLGIILLLLIIYAGFLWMTAGGNSDQIEKAKKIMINAVIGLIILLAAYAISNFVISALNTAGLAT